jgi:quinol monooxygenase YgiN
MFIRFVRMTFQEDKPEEFQEVFDSSKDKIRAMHGCQHHVLMRDINQPNIYMTHRI